jgi:hypothetical protein
MTRAFGMIAAVMVATTLQGVAAQAADDRTAPAGGEVRRLARTPIADVRAAVQARLAAVPGTDPSVAAALEALWSDVAASDGDLLERIARSAALADDRTAALVRLGSSTTDPWHVPQQRWLYEEGRDPWVRDQLRLYFGRWLAQRKMYDAALEMLAGLEPNDVVDPAVLLFYQGAAYHHQLRKAAGLRVLDRLLNDTADCPQRFEVVAGLMREDLKKLEDETLDHVARRMDDVQRRLDIGDGGRRTQRIERGIIESLDKMIEEMEKQQQQSQASGGGQSSAPMQDSRIAKQKGPGNVDKKDIGKKSEWGDLPNETREQIRQQLGKDLPAHYYDLIQQYFGNREGEKSPSGK